jgi:hypothetical protein
MSRSAGERDENLACGPVAVVIENTIHNRKIKTGFRFLLLTASGPGIVQPPAWQ